MEFRNFLENAGYFDDKEDTRPHGMGRQQDMPGTSLVASTRSMKGKVIEILIKPNKVVMSVLNDDPDMDQEEMKVTKVVIPLSRYQQEREQAPHKGDIVQVELDSANNLISYDVLHRFSA